MNQSNISCFSCPLCLWGVFSITLWVMVLPMLCWITDSPYVNARVSCYTDKELFFFWELNEPWAEFFIPLLLVSLLIIFTGFFSAEDSWALLWVFNFPPYMYYHVGSFPKHERVGIISTILRKLDSSKMSDMGLASLGGRIKVQVSWLPEVFTGQLWGLASIVSKKQTSLWRLTPVGRTIDMNCKEVL